MKLTDENISKAIDKLKSLTFVGKPSYVAWVPRGEAVISKRYRGKGRPRNSDYDYIEINWKKILKEANQ